MAEDNRALVGRFFEQVINAGALELVDEVLAPDYTDHSPQADLGPGAEGFKRRIAVLRDSFAMHLTVEAMTAEEDRVAFAWTMTGSHVGEFAGVAPTRLPVKLTGLNLERVTGGRIVEHWSEYDRLGLLRQIDPDAD